MRTRLTRSGDEGIRINQLQGSIKATVEGIGRAGFCRVCNAKDWASVENPY